MSNATLRTVGGSVVVALPRPALQQLKLRAGSRVTVAVERGKVTLTPASKPRYTLAELLASCDFKKRPSRDEREWQKSKPVGKEVI